jgi:RNA polymerase primary sigma factor
MQTQRKVKGNAVAVECKDRGRQPITTGKSSPAVLGADFEEFRDGTWENDQTLDHAQAFDAEIRNVENEAFSATVPGADGVGPSPDDGLSAYLKQMGSIPLLNRQQELELATRLDITRRRYRHAALWSWGVLAQAVDTFERVHSGELPLDRTIDVVPSLDMTPARIRKRIPRHLGRLRQLCQEAVRVFEQLLRARSQVERSGLRRALRSRLRLGVRLVEELSPRTELVDCWAEALKRKSARMQELVRQVERLGRSAAARAERVKRVKELRRLTMEVQAIPEELARWAQVLDRRRAPYQQARRELAAANLRLVISVAKRYRGRGLPFADLIQEGNSGLMRAVDKFDHRLGWKFGTYATWWVRQGVTRALADTSRTVRLPCHRGGMLREIERVQAEFMVKNRREPTAEEIAMQLKVTPADVRSVLAFGHQPLSLDGGYNPDGEEDSFVNILADRGAASPAEEVDRRLLKERVAELLRCLAPRDREVIELRYGLRDGTARSTRSPRFTGSRASASARSRPAGSRSCGSPNAETAWPSSRSGKGSDTDTGHERLPRKTARATQAGRQVLGRIIGG